MTVQNGYAVSVFTGARDESGCRGSRPFVQTQWILTGPHRHRNPLEFEMGNGVVQHRFDSVRMALWAWRRDQLIHHATWSNRADTRQYGSASSEAEPQIPPWSHRQMLEAGLHLQ